MSSLKTKNDEFAVIIETDPICIGLKERTAYNIANGAAREYFAFPGPKSVPDLMATVGNALTSSKEEFPQDMREVVLQQTVNNYISRI